MGWYIVYIFQFYYLCSWYKIKEAIHGIVKASNIHLKSDWSREKDLEDPEPAAQVEG